MTRHVHLCTIAGIHIRLHWSFLLLPALFGWFFGLKGLFAVGFVFLCVTLHELCHSLQARQFGMTVRNITLFPIGGVSQLHSFGHQPREEFITSLVGPLFNFALAAVLFLPAYHWLGPEVLFQRTVMFRFSFETWQQTLASCFWINPLLGCFNLLPAFPMDGGRILRSLLTQRLGLLTATRTAVGVGRIFMVGFVVLGILSNPWLLVIAAFLYVSGEQEAAQVEVHAALTRTRVQDILWRRVVSVPATMTLGELTAVALQASQDDFPVMEAGQLVGWVDRRSLSAAMQGHQAHIPVRTVMRTAVPTVSPQDQLAEVYARMTRAHLAALPVVEGTTLVGLVTIDDVQQVLRWAKQP